ncbi:hypothetical protein N7474_007707 [Penicillium riverlandense]|uniref:uncharacterized protein n=1 Tax=Penicillium riverlandense TaxID=1903569 RepID=UPI0025471D93|nr:uncharacterized protein N7474_007707 [Penicillium riverlandense]KAJ5811406.1 hypothetical protein N7474_007707 [Penicillium riverlandense]
MQKVMSSRSTLGMIRILIYKPSLEPFLLPEVAEIIQESQLRRKGQTQGKSPLIDFQTRLPREVLYMILDYMDYSFLPILQSMFQSPFLDPYWRRRARPFLTEFEDIRDRDLDWQFLCLKIEKLDAVDDAFHSRKRVVGILEEIKTGILKKLEEGDEQDVMTYFESVFDFYELERTDVRNGGDNGRGS